MKILSMFVLQAALVSGASVSGLSRTPAADTAPSPTQAVQPLASVDAFDQLDADRDGVLSRTELARHPKAAHMAMVDENGDGVLDRGEFMEMQGM